MRNGRSILIVAVGFLVAWIIQPVWQWYFDRALDAASRPHGVAGMIAATIPAHPLLLGISIGMGLALVIGYWGTVDRGVHTSWLTARFVLLGLWRAVPSIFPIAAFTGVLEPDETTADVIFPSEILIREVICQPAFSLYWNRRAESSTVVVNRIAGNTDPIKVEIYIIRPVNPCMDCGPLIG